MTAARSTHEAGEVRERRRVVVIEDDAEMCGLVGHALREDGHDVSTFTDAFAALAQLYSAVFYRTPQPHLLVADLRLPGVNGLEIVSRLRRVGCRFPAIIMSGFADDKLRARADDLLIIRVFDKPFDLDVLRTFVNEHFQTQRRR